MLQAHGYICLGGERIRFSSLTPKVDYPDHHEPPELHEVIIRPTHSTLSPGEAVFDEEGYPIEQTT